MKPSGSNEIQACETPAEANPLPLAPTLAGIAALGLVAGCFLLSPVFYSSHDGTDHVTLLAQYFAAFKNGQFPVRWLSDLMGGYGLPVFVYAYQLPFFLGLFPQFAGLDAIWTYKLLMLLALPASGIAMFLFARDLMSSRAALLASVVYMLVPYRFVDIYVRGALPESMSFVFIPLVFLGARKVVDERGLHPVLLLAASLGALILTHNISAMICFGLVILYALYLILLRKSARPILPLVCSFVLALAVSAFYWVPAIAELGNVSMGDPDSGALVYRIQDHFVYGAQFISNFWGYGSSLPGRDDGMSFQIGNWLIAAVLLAGFMRGRKVKDKPVLMFFPVAFLACWAMAHAWSEPLWNVLPLVRYFQFPWRFLTLTCFLGAACFGMFFTVLESRPASRKTMWAGFMLLTLGLDVLGWLLWDSTGWRSPSPGHLYATGRVMLDILLALVLTGIVFRLRFSARTMLYGFIAFLVLGAAPLWFMPLQRAILDKPSISSLQSGDLTPSALRARMDATPTGARHADLPRSCLFPPETVPNHKVVAVDGTGSIFNVSQNGDRLEFEVRAAEPTLIQVNIFHFPGWMAFLDGQPVEPCEVDMSGCMCFSIPQGDHRVALRFGRTPLRMASELVSVAALGLGLLFLFRGFLKSR